MEPLTAYNQGKKLHLERVEAFIPADVRDKFCQCQDYYPISKTDGIFHCDNCDKVSFYLRSNPDVPDNALTYTVKYADMYPYVNVKTSTVLKLWVAEVRYCDMCEENFIVPELPYDNEFCPDCEAVQ